MLKGFLTAVLIFLVLVVAANLLDVFNVVSLDKLAQNMPTRVVNLVFPSQNYKRNRNAGETGAITGVDAFNAAGSNEAVSTDAIGLEEVPGAAEPEGDAFGDEEFGEEEFGEDAFGDAELGEEETGEQEQNTGNSVG